MEVEDPICNSNSSSPVDPLAPLSDCAPGSLCSSWGSEDFYFSPIVNRTNDATTVTINCYEANELSWQQRYAHLQTELMRFQNQASQVKNALQEKLSKMELRVAEAELRAEEAHIRVRLMEEKLQQTMEWPSTCCEALNGETGEQNADNAISNLAYQVEEQRQLRLQDAKFVEAKAAHIREWVTNKLRILETQNQLLREQNLKYNEQLELLRWHMAQLIVKKPLDMCETAADATISSPPSTFSIADSVDVFSQNVPESEPVYAQVDRQKIANKGDLPQLQSQPPSLPADIHSQASLPSRLAKSQSAGVVESDLTHDYAEIYTPSGEKVSLLDWERNGCGNGGGQKPPTPPLHKFPSWESRIYRVANEGLSNLTVARSSSAHQPSKVTSPQPRSRSTLSYSGSGFYDISYPLYATVKGRASQICSSPVNGDLSDDSSDGEDHLHGHLGASSSRVTNSSTDNTDNSISSSSPSKSHSHKTGSSLSPLKCNSFSSPSKNMSLESGISDDYAIPPDAVSGGDGLSDWSAVTATAAAAAAESTIAASPDHQKSPVHEPCAEKCGNLAKLGGKLKTWRKRWFHLGSTGVLRYWKTQGDIHRKPRGEIFINELCTVCRCEAETTFEISTPKKTYYLTADLASTIDEWIRALQNIQGKNATKLLLNKDNFKPTVQGWLTIVRNGHAKKYWCILVEKTFLYLKSESDNNPNGQINMKEAKVEQVEHVSDSDSDEKNSEKPRRYTIGIFPSTQPPIYLLVPSKQEMDLWLYHLTVVSGVNPNVGTQYEQIIQKLMETDGDTNNVLWKHPLLQYSKDTINTSLTTLSSETLVTEALNLFKSCQLFTSVAVESTGIDYHVVLAQNALQQCLDNWQLQSELICILVKQTSPHSAHKVGAQVLSKLRHRSLFACDSAGSPTIANVPPMPICAAANAEVCKSNPATFVFLQGWQLLALAISLFVPKDHKILWHLKYHIARNADTRSECGKYAAYCERALQRTIQNGNRDMKPSRMEVLSILLKNPYHHSLPHSIPVHFLNGSYQVVGFDGSTIVKEFLKTLTQDTGCRESSSSGFTLFSDDPIDKDLEHYIDPRAKLCDVISKWETILREKGSGKFENSRVIQLVFKNRLYFKNSTKNETDREKLLLCYQTNQQIINRRFPLTKEFALELAALMAQIDFGEFHSEKSRGSGGVSSSANSSKDLIILQAVDKFYPYRYRDNLSPEALRELQNELQEKWLSLKGRSTLDCIRIYLNCTRKWPNFGASLFQTKWKQGENPSLGVLVVWLAVSENNISVLELDTMQPVTSYSYSQILTFGGCQDDFMIVVNSDDGSSSHKLLFSMSRPKILELTLIIADYMNALGQNNCAQIRNNIQPDLLKATPDHQLNRSDSKKYHFES